MQPGLRRDRVERLPCGSVQASLQRVQRAGLRESLLRKTRAERAQKWEAMGLREPGRKVQVSVRSRRAVGRTLAQAQQVSEPAQTAAAVAVGRTAAKEWRQVLPPLQEPRAQRVVAARARMAK